jgi:hypothetical protein
MSEKIVDLVVATVFLTAGSAIFLNLDALAELDQRSGLRSHNWFKKRLGAESFLNREIYSVGTPSGHRKSKIGIGIAGVLCLISGVVALSFWVIQYFH